MAASLIQHGSSNSTGQNGVGNATASSSPGQTGKKRRRQGKSSSSGIGQTSSMTRALVNGENGLSSSNNTAADEELEQQLEPTADECSKLAAVIRM